MNRCVARERLPVAFIKHDLYYLLDSDGMVLAGFSLGDARGYPLIVGLENRLPKFTLGAVCPVPILKSSLLLAKTLAAQAHQIEESMASLQRRRITRIDASDPNQLSFYLGEDLRVRVGGGDFDDKIDLLPMILRSIGADLGSVKYIDLRPKVPVVATKDEKKKNR